MVFYNREGHPCCYTDDFMHIYSYSGDPLGYIQNNKVWNYDGRYLGLFRNNWVIDRDGCYLFFTENSTGGPMRPLRELAPLKSLKKLRPLKSIKEIAPIPPMTTLSWSGRGVKTFFEGE